MGKEIWVDGISRVSNPVTKCSLANGARPQLTAVTVRAELCLYARPLIIYCYPLYSKKVLYILEWYIFVAVIINKYVTLV